MRNSSAARRRTESAALDPPPSGFDIEAWAASTAAPGDYFSEVHAAHAAAFFPRYLRHIKGRHAGQPFVLLDWERALVRTIFGWRRADGTRRFRIVYVEIARKNGKTALAAGIALYLAFLAGEPGAEVYCAATDKTQARVCFEMAKAMRTRVRWFLEKTDAFKDNISRQATGDKLEVLSAEDENKHGLNVSGLVADELHVWKGRKLYDALHTATGARDQPLEILITTAGEDTQSICWAMHNRALKVRDRIIQDPAFLPLIFAADPKDPIDDPRTWAKANPSLDAAVSSDYLATEVKNALEDPSYLPVFKRLHLNIWGASTERWLPATHWDACGVPAFSEAMLHHRACWAGLDMSSTTDLTAFVMVFPPVEGDEGPLAGRWVVQPRFWTPEATMRRRQDRDGVPYKVWADQGLIRATEGNIVDYDKVRADILADAELFLIKEIAVDRWNATQIMTQLGNEGAVVVPFGQGFGSMTEPTKRWGELVISETLAHGGNPVLNWMSDNIRVKRDEAGNIKPAKNRSTGRIDGIVGGIMGLGRAIATAGKPDLGKALAAAIMARGGLA